jgi:predicted nucleotidyltransferase
MIALETIQEFNQRVVHKYRPNKIILFGSYATGAPTADSDVDILVILPFQGKSVEMSADILNQIDPRFPIDLLVRTPEQVQDRLEKGDYFIQEIMRQGKVLYEASDA